MAVCHDQLHERYYIVKITQAELLRLNYDTIDARDPPCDPILTDWSLEYDRIQILPNQIPRTYRLRGCIIVLFSINFSVAQSFYYSSL